MRCLLLLLWLPAQSKIQAPPSVLFEDLQELFGVFIKIYKLAVYGLLLCFLRKERKQII